MSAPTMDRDGDITVIDFGDDENVTSLEWTGAMNSLLDEFEAIEGPKGLVTTGGGKHYSNGLDTGWMASNQGSVGDYIDGVVAVVRRLTLLGAPTGAAVNGHAFGMGAFLVMAHDQAVMRSDRGYVCFPEVHLGMPIPPFLMALADPHLPRRFIRQAILSGGRYGAADAIAGGMVDEARPLDEVLAATIERVAPLAPTAGANLAGLKRDLFPVIAEYHDGALPPGQLEI